MPDSPTAWARPSCWWPRISCARSSRSRGPSWVSRATPSTATALERWKRFQVADPLTVGEIFAPGAAHVEEVLGLPNRAMRLARTLEVTGWLVPVVLQRRGVTYLDTTWISAVTGTALFSRRQPLVPPAAAEEQRFPWEPPVED